MKLIISLFAGAVFGVGLAVSGMVDPARVQGFLDVTGRWDPSLAFVMGGALAVTSLGYAWLRKRGAGVGGLTLQWPTRNDVSAKLVVGAAMFGAGWGLAGLCPGPALGSLAIGGTQIVTFVAVMTASLWLTFIAMNRPK
jgi:uncharacterized membrane protein YedE/YeeE